MMLNTLTHLNTSESTAMKTELVNIIQHTEVLKTVSEKDMYGAAKGKECMSGFTKV